MSAKFENDGDLREWLIDSVSEGSLSSIHLIDGYASACIGIDIDSSEHPRLVYSVQKIIEQLKIKDNLDEEEAIDFYEYNIARGIVYTKNPPILVQDFWTFM